MADAIAVLNAGSSSIKFSLFVLRAEQAELLARGQTEAIYTAPRFVAKNGEGRVIAEMSWPEGTRLGHEGALEHLFSYVRGEFAGHHLMGVGHRVVHGGLEYTEPLRVNPEVLARLERLIPLVPLHQPHNLAPIRLLLERRPELPQVACFDTSFHRTNPHIAQLYAIPLEYAEAGVIRYRFHGLSYEYIASALPKFDAHPGEHHQQHRDHPAHACSLPLRG